MNATLQKRVEEFNSKHDLTILTATTTSVAGATTRAGNSNRSSTPRVARTLCRPIFNPPDSPVDLARVLVPSKTVPEDEFQMIQFLGSNCFSLAGLNLIACSSFGPIIIVPAHAHPTRTSTHSSCGNSIFSQVPGSKHQHHFLREDLNRHHQQLRVVLAQHGRLPD